MPKINPERSAARQAGETKYISSAPCKRGHVGLRYTSAGDCCECRYENNLVHNPRSAKARRDARKGRQTLDHEVEDIPLINRARVGDLVTWGGPYVNLMGAGWRI